MVKPFFECKYEKLSACYENLAAKYEKLSVYYEKLSAYYEKLSAYNEKSKVSFYEYGNFFFIDRVQREEDTVIRE